jgi:hypothetical protein
VSVNSQSEPGSDQPPEGPHAKKLPKLIPSTLADFLLEGKASAREFVRSLAKRPPLAEDDLVRSHEILSADPLKIKKALELTRAATAAVPQPGVLLRWCEQVVRSRDEGLRDWALDPNQPASAAFDQLLTWAYPNIREKGDRSKRQLAEVTLSLGLSLLLGRRSLSPLDALRSISSATTSRGTRRRPSPETEAGKLIRRASTKQLFDFAQLITLAEAEIASAQDAQRRVQSLVDEARREQEALEAARDVLRAKTEELDRELAQRNSQIEELSVDLEGTKTRAMRDLSSLKARFRRQIGERLAGLLADAWDALDTEPPHPDVAKERLEVAREGIRTELEWLGRSSD